MNLSETLPEAGTTEALARVLRLQQDLQDGMKRDRAAGIPRPPHARRGAGGNPAAKEARAFIRVVMLLQYRYRLNRKDALAKLNELGVAITGDAFRRMLAMHGSDEELHYNPYGRRRWYYHEVEKELRAKEVVIRERFPPKAKLGMRRVLHYGCLRRLGHPDWQAPLKNVMENKYGCPRCGVMHRLRQPRAKVALAPRDT